MRSSPRGRGFGRRVAQGGITAGMLNALVAMDLPGPGVYRLRLSAQRVVSRRPLQETFEIAFADKDVDFLNKSRGRSFLVFPVKKP
jgi:hypothetical protein